MSTATAQPEYATLLARTLPAVIHSEKENERCISMLEALDRKAEKLTGAERRLAELLTVLIEDFDGPPGPISSRLTEPRPASF